MLPLKIKFTPSGAAPPLGTTGRQRRNGSSCPAETLFGVVFLHGRLSVTSRTFCERPKKQVSATITPEFADHKSK